MTILEETSEQFLVFSQEDQYYDMSFDLVPSSYIDASRADWRLLKFEEEATDREILRFAEQSECLDFLNEPQEDIYGLDDGTAV